jgi:glucose-1-phosphate thymidylyltransferase
MKGIILAGGSGTRTTNACYEQANDAGVWQTHDLLPVSTLMMAGINEILIISTPYDLLISESCWGDGASV